jgi:hypothetical protein
MFNWLFQKDSQQFGFWLQLNQVAGFNSCFGFGQKFSRSYNGGFGHGH